MEPIILKIAHDILGLQTLDVRHSDALDFHALSVMGIRRALEAAYEAGASRAPQGGGVVPAPVVATEFSPAPDTVAECDIAPYLKGYTGADPMALKLIEHIQDWPHLAQEEIRQRASRVLSVFDHASLLAVAAGTADIRAICQNLKKDVP